MIPMIFISLLLTRLSVAQFFHGPSNISIHPEMLETNSDFGFAMGYLTATKKLVIGAPSASLVGKVYICGLDTLPEINCQEKPYKMPPEYSKKKVEGYKSFLGASIAAYSDHFLTCAPLWTVYTEFKSYNGIEVIDVIGTCLFDENSAPYFGSYDKHFLNIHNKTHYRIYASQAVGGIGWSTLVDEANDLLLIAKSALHGDLIPSTLPRNFSPESIKKSFTTSLVSTKTENKNFYRHRFNFGFGMTSGKFFSQSDTVYAINMDEEDMRGAVYFIQYDSAKKTLQKMVLKTKAIGEKDYVMIHTIDVGTKFGSVMAATDLTKDGLDELLVAEPLYSEEDGIECGSLHIYKMDEKKQIREHLQIIGTENFGRLGSAIAVNDIDGDGIAEIVVSALYANGGLGIIYILSGYEVNQMLHQRTTLQLSELKHTQHLLSKVYRKLGFSLQFITDIDGNGCNDLVAGAPGSGKAVLFKCLQAIDIKLSNELEQVVREQDLSFTVKVCAEVTYPEKPKDIYAEITLKSNIVGVRASVATPEINVNISCNNCPNKQKFCENITVNFIHVEPGDYTFHSEAKLLTDHIFRSSVLNISWVTYTPYSQLKTERNIPRHCVGTSGEDCKPKLSMDLSWPWREEEQYILGTSDLEKLTIRVANDGHNAYEACVLIKIEGAQVQQLSKGDECRAHDGGYTCDLPKPFGRDQKRDIKLLLSMPDTNEIKNLDVKASLYETCRNELTIKEEKAMNLSYVTNTNEVSIYGKDHERLFSENQKNYNKSAIIEVQEFVITNNGKITWKKINITISTNKTEYTKSFNVTVGGFHCEEFHTQEKFNHKCYLNIMPTSTLKVIATMHILKSNLESHLIDKKLIMIFKMELHLNATEVKKISIRSVLKFETELAVGQNKLLIGIIATVIGLLVLIVIAVALYKSGFFERKEKRKLLVHKESFRRRSSRRNTHIYSTAEESGIEDNEDTREDDDVFHSERATTPPQRRSSDVIQIEAKAQVHCQRKTFSK